MDFNQAIANKPAVQHFFNPTTSTLPLYLEPVNKIITLRNIQGRITAVAQVIPTQNGLTGELLGVERLSQTQKDSRAFSVAQRQKIKITDGTTFDLSDDVQRTNWNWVQYSIYIVQSKEDALKSPNALFYVEDSERDTNAKLKKSEIFFEAETLVRNWSEPVRMNRARLLGHDLSMHTPGEILDYMLDFVRASVPNAQRVISIEADPYKQERLELLRWKDADLITEKNGGAWFFGEIRMGTDEMSSIGWVLQVENREIVRTIRDRFSQLQRPNLSGAQVIPVRGGLKPATDAAGQPLQPRSTSVEPIMQAPRRAPQPGELSLADVAKLAPTGYAQLVATQSPAILAYLEENPDQDLFKDLVKQEITRNVLFNRGKPEAAPTQEAQPFPGVPEAALMETPIVGKTADVDDLYGEETFQQVSNEQPVGSPEPGSVSADQPPLLDQPDETGVPSADATTALTTIALDAEGVPLKGLAKLNYERAQAAAAKRENPDFQV